MSVANRGLKSIYGVEKIHTQTYTHIYMKYGHTYTWHEVTRSGHRRSANANTHIGNAFRLTLVVEARNPNVQLGNLQYLDDS
jgi:hypothetical protein